MKKIFSLLLVFLISISCLSILVNAESNVTVTVDGSIVSFDQKPIIENDRVLVPVRAIFESLGATVTWNEQNRIVTAKKDNSTIVLQIDKKLMQKNGKSVLLDVAPKIVNSRTLVPLRAISEAFGANVEWIDTTYSVIITTTQVTPPSTTPPTENNFEKQVLNLVNEERAKNGLNPLVWNDDLATVARNHSKDMNDRNYMAHNNPDGLTPFDRIKNYGIKYSRAAENIAAGQSTPEAVMKGWMNSEGHRANILNPNLKMLGVGYYKGNGSYTHYWTQCFITP